MSILFGLSGLGIGTVLGIFLTITVAPLLLHDRPMDGARYTGELGNIDQPGDHQ
jgi:hypothetical protein